MATLILPSISLISPKISDEELPFLHQLVDFFTTSGCTYALKKGYFKLYSTAAVLSYTQASKMLTSYILDNASKGVLATIGLKHVDLLLNTLWVTPPPDEVDPGETIVPVVTTVIKKNIPDEIRDLLIKHVRWSATNNGDPVYMIRTTLNSQCWEVALNPWAALKMHQHPEVEGKSYIDHLSHVLFTMQKEGKTTWGVETATDEITKDVLQVFTPLMDMVNNKKFENTFKSDLKCAISPFPVNFSNDASTICSCYFGLDRLPENPQPSEYEAYTDFESQMPTWAVPMWRASFYGIFCDKNRSRQMVILQDSGQTGKSNMVRAITSVASGNFYAALSKDSFINNFWGSKILGRRLIVFSDSGNTKITQMDKLKQISGGDPLDVELKGVSGQVRYTPNSRVLITTNSSPDILTYAKHQTSRIIIIPLTATRNAKLLKKFCQTNENGDIVYDKEGEPVVIGAPYDRWFQEQFYPYLSVCKSSYELLCPTHQEIIPAPEMLEYMADNCTSVTTDALSYIMSTYLILDPNGKIPNSTLSLLVKQLSEDTHNPDVTLEQLHDYLKLKKCSRTIIGQVDKSNIGALPRGMKGVRLRPEWKVQQDRIGKTTPTVVEDLVVNPVEIK
jgi:hypothetical protein